MGNRLSRIITRTGDDGSTGLGDGTRVRKDAARIEALGSVDELNCTLGVLLSNELHDEAASACLTEVQHDLFDLGGELSIPGSSMLSEERVIWLDAQLEQFNRALPPLKEFVLPGGGTSASASHIARAVCRRAERYCWTLARNEPVSPAALRYLNRLSDILFVLARRFARAERGSEPLWNRARQGEANGEETGSSQ
ncbi:MAG TPA: cob(I)yrinic acid a,c-diamide adenosyltransferase [Steroidobacteraceae bacterium]